MGTKWVPKISDSIGFPCDYGTKLLNKSSHSKYMLGKTTSLCENKLTDKVKPSELNFFKIRFSSTLNLYLAVGSTPLLIRRTQAVAG